jgi:hypothetical protein
MERLKTELDPAALRDDRGYRQCTNDWRIGNRPA